MTNQEEAGISSLILTIRGQKVILDSDLAKIYGVSTKRLNEQVRRNGDRFPEDFVFQLSALEDSDLRSQIATSNGWTNQEQLPIKRMRGGRRYLPYAFTEHSELVTFLRTSPFSRVKIKLGQLGEIRLTSVSILLSIKRKYNVK